MEEVVRWDEGLCDAKTFMTAVNILSGCKYNFAANSLETNAMKSKPIESRESLREGVCLIFLDYVKNSLNNNSVREYQDVDSCSEFELISNIVTKTAIITSNNTAMQCNPIVMRGLQGIIRGRQTNIKMTSAGGG